ncbi:MAG TPA: NADH-quinone oxidoreductase subunit C [Chloroflexota bacterium]|nr:NADH-quinone oxidoreductase subunit C [Chloroflexota bacterium]
MSDTNPDGDTVVEQLRAAFPTVSFRMVDPGVPSCVVPTEQVADVASFLKSTPGLDFNYLASITAIDYLDRFDVVYQIRSLVHNQDFIFRVEVDRDGATVPSVTRTWRAADFQEREIFDLMGLEFSGHPNLSRILLYDEFDGHPLRKDWRLPAEPRS